MLRRVPSSILSNVTLSKATPSPMHNHGNAVHAANDHLSPDPSSFTSSFDSFRHHRKASEKIRGCWLVCDLTRLRYCCTHTRTPPSDTLKRLQRRPRTPWARRTAFQAGFVDWASFRGRSGGRGAVSNTPRPWWGPVHGGRNETGRERARESGTVRVRARVSEREARVGE